MISNILNRNKKKVPIPKPSKEVRNSTVSTKRFNDMIEYYSTELKSRIKEIEELKKHNELMIKASLRSASRADEAKLEASKLREELRKRN